MSTSDEYVEYSVPSSNMSSLEFQENCPDRCERRLTSLTSFQIENLKTIHEAPIAGAIKENQSRSKCSVNLEEGSYRKYFIGAVVCVLIGVVIGAIIGVSVSKDKQPVENGDVMARQLPDDNIILNVTLLANLKIHFEKENYGIVSKHIADDIKNELTRKPIYITDVTVGDPVQKLCGEGNCSDEDENDTLQNKEVKKSKLSFLDISIELIFEAINRFQITVFEDYIWDRVNVTLINNKYDRIKNISKKGLHSVDFLLMNRCFGSSCLSENWLQTKTDRVLIAIFPKQSIGGTQEQRFRTSSFHGEDSVLNMTVADELEIQNSCSLMLNGSRFYIGGGTDRNQVLEMNFDNFQNEPIMRRGTLSTSDSREINFKEGACGTFHDKNGKEFALLCFDREDPTTCYKCYDLINGKCEKINSFPTNKSTRNAIRIGNYQGKAIACGGWSTLTCDIMDMKDENPQWISTEAFPCSNQSGNCVGIYWYATVSLETLFVIFGGTHDGTHALNGIFGFTNDVWTKLGTLNQARYQHSAISNSNEIMVVGGLTSKSSEVQTLKTEVWNTEFTHNRTIKPELSDCNFYPELFLVPYNFPWHMSPNLIT